MSRYGSSTDHLAYGSGPERWDSERFNQERERDRFGRGGGARYDERDTRISFNRTGGPPARPRERSVDEVYERDVRGPRGYEDDVYERRHYHEDEPRMERERAPMGRNRGASITLERERERYDEPPPRRPGGNRPAFLRRQSSLDTFDRKPLNRFSDRDRLEEYGPPARFQREEYGPPARYERRDELRPPALTPIPLPVRKALGPPPRRFEEEREYYEDIKVAEPDFYGDDEFRGYPERVREREIIRSRRRSKSKESRGGGRSVKGSVKGSVRGGSVASSSRSSSSSSRSSFETVRNEFPKKGKTRMPARLVSKKAIIDLNYPFEEEGDTIIILKALGRENIDEVIKLSEDYKSEKQDSGGNNVVYEEQRTTEVITVPSPAPPPQIFAPPPPMPSHDHVTEVIKDTRIVDVHRDPSPAYSHRSHQSHHHHGSHGSPIIRDAGPREESTFIEKKKVEVIERSDPMPVGPLALALPSDRRRVPDERSIRAEIKALEAEKEALKAQRRADREIRRADRYRGESHSHGRVSESEMVVYDRERYDTVGDEVTMVRTERFVEPEGGVKIQKDKKAPPPGLVRAMLKTLT